MSYLFFQFASASFVYFALSRLFPAKSTMLDAPVLDDQDNMADIVVVEEEGKVSEFK